MLDATLFPIPATTRGHADPRPLIVDSFAGGGGASTGIELALGRGPDIAINHSESALALHAANHPETLHLSENVYRVDPLTHMAGRHIGLMWFSPDCKHFSKAKGGTPVKRNIRDLAWIIPGWIERIQKSGGRVDVVLLENVEEFRTWGPLIETDKGLMPDPARAGETFAAWCKKLRRLGGRIDMRELRACDYGAPTIRKRLFVIVRFDRRPIVWPQPTHGNPASPEVQAGKLLPWRTAADCIDWSQPCPSIFASGAEIMVQHGLRAVRPLKPNTLARIARGLHRYVLGSERPFLVNLTHGGRIEDLADPFRTITGAHRGEKALVAPTLANVANGKTSGRGPNTWTVQEPLRTITAAPGHALITPSLTRFNGGATGADLRDPMPTVTANSWIKRPGGAAPLGLLAPILAHFYTSNTAGGQGDPRQPAKTVTAGGQHHSAILPYLASIAHGDSGGRREYPLADPLGTVTVGGIQHALVAPVLTYAQQGGGNRPATAPHHTICASSKDQNSLIAAYFAKYYGTGDGARHDEPAHTVTVRDRFAHVQADLGAPPFAPEHEDRARAVAQLLRDHGLWDEREFVTLTIDSAEFVIVDIGMRMLTPRELFNAQGFPPDYVIEGVWQGLDTDEPTFKPFPKDVQVSCCGNSVCPPLAEALARANCGHLAVEKERKAA